MRHAWYQLRLLADKRLEGLLLLGRRHTLAAPHYAAHPEWRLAQIGDPHVGVKRPHPSCAVLPHDEFQVIVSRRQDKTRVVLHILSTHLLRAIYCQLHRVAQAPDWEFSALLHLADN